MMIGIAVCAILLNIIWFAVLVNWPDIRFENTILFTILLSFLVTILSAWSLIR